MSARDELNLVDRFWLVLSSMRTTAVLAILLALLAGVAAVVPQGREAMALMRLPHTEQLQELAAWGLTDLFETAWVRALGVLILANVLAVTVRVLKRDRVDQDFGVAPSGAPHTVELASTTPELAVEQLRESFREVLGSAPTDERVEGARVTMSFQTSPSADMAPLLAHLGLIALVVGAGLAAQPVPLVNTMVSAVLEVKDSRTQTVGLFDMVQDESRQFFQWRPRYFLRNYAATKDGMGPAVRIEKVIDDTKRIDEFWVYLNAPEGFDEKHRQGFVAVKARSMGRRPTPGKGLSQSSAGLLLLAGLGLLMIGLATGSKADGRLWIDVDGDKVRLIGVPARSGDRAFAGAFSRWSLLARAALSA